MTKKTGLVALVTSEETSGEDGLDNIIPNLTLAQNMPAIHKKGSDLIVNYGLPIGHTLQYAKNKLSLGNTHCLFYD